MKAKCLDRPHAPPARPHVRAAQVRRPNPGCADTAPRAGGFARFRAVGMRDAKCIASNT